MAVITGRKQILAFRMKTLASAIELEAKGLKRRGRSAYVIAKEEFQLKGTRQAVADQLRSMAGESQST